MVERKAFSSQSEPNDPVQIDSSADSDDSGVSNQQSFAFNRLDFGSENAGPELDPSAEHRDLKKSFYLITVQRVMLKRKQHLIYVNQCDKEE
jgi:hypothetical protein